MIDLKGSSNRKKIVFGIAKDKHIKETAGTMIEKGRGRVRCPICQQTTPVEDLRFAGIEGKMGERMVAVVTDSPRGKDYRPIEQHDLEAFEQVKRVAKPSSLHGRLFLKINGISRRGCMG